MRKYLFLFLFGFLFFSCTQNVNQKEKVLTWDKENIRYLNNSTDEEILNMGKFNIYNRTAGETGVIGQFNYKYETLNLTEEMNFIFEIQEKDVPYFSYVYVENYSDKPNIVHWYGEFELVQRNGDFYFLYKKKNCYYKYYVSDNYLYCELKPVKLN